MSDDRDQFGDNPGPGAEPTDSSYVPELTPVEAPPAEGETSPRRRGSSILTGIAWVFIVGLVVLTVWLQGQRGGSEEAPAATEGAAAEPEVMSLQLRYVIGAKTGIQQLADMADVPGLGADDGRDLLAQLGNLKGGPPADRLRYVIVAGELVGPAEALRALEEVREGGATDWPKGLRELRDALDRLYRDYAAFRFDAPSVSASERADLADRLGWLGRLALAPQGVWLPRDTPAAVGAAPALGLTHAGGADRQEREAILAPALHTFFTVLVGFGGASLLAVAGTIALLVFAGFVAGGAVPSRLHLGPGHGGVYAETFALWMALYLGLSVLVGVLDLPFPRYLVLLVVFFGSLVVLGWPVLRGVPWATVRADVGLHTGRGTLTEVFCGAAAYVMTLPLLVVGALLVLLLAFLVQLLSPDGAAGDLQDAAHPVVEYAAQGGWWDRVQLFLLAAVAAPVVEETMFRGVLYRHLREASRRWGLVLSVLASGLLVSFIFAAIHPQGLIAAPALMSLAFGFTLAREWRGSLIPCMVAHGISNGLVMTVLLFALG